MTMGQARKRGTFEERKAAAEAKAKPSAAEGQGTIRGRGLAGLVVSLFAAQGMEGAASPRELAMVSSRYTKRGRGGW